MDNISEETNVSKLVCFPSEKVSTQNGIGIAPKGSKFILFILDPFSERDGCAVNDGGLVFYVPFNIFKSNRVAGMVIMKALCSKAVKSWTLPPAGFKPGTPRSEDGSANHSASRTLRYAGKRNAQKCLPVKKDNFSDFPIAFLPPRTIEKRFCLCWSSTTHSTQWSHIERGKFTYHIFFWLCWGLTSTLVGYFVLSPREREKTDRRYSRSDEREGHARKRKMN